MTSCLTLFLKKSSQAFRTQLNPNEEKSYPLLIDPLKKNDQTTQKAWFNAYAVAVSVIKAAINDPTDGATYFHSSDLSQEIFLKNSVPGAIFTQQIDDFLFYKDSNDF